MAQKQWHIERNESGVTLSRHCAARFDFSAQLVLKGGGDLRRARIAHQVRQDLWRGLQHLRGFAPVVQVRAVGSDLEITAGGAVAGRFPKAKSEELVAEVLNCPKRQARWARSAVRHSEPAA